MLKGLAIGIEHFPDYKPYKSKPRYVGTLLFASGINVIICSQIEQEMSDAVFDVYCSDWAVIPKSRPRTPQSSRSFEEFVFGF